MKNILIILLGNRDIQLSGDSRKELKGEYYSYFEKNVDGSDYYVVDKKFANEQKLSFLEISEVIWNEYSYFINLMSFELYEKTIQVLEKEKVEIDKVIVTTSNQNPRYQQDCYFIALCLEKYLSSKGILCELQLCYDNPNKFELLVPFYANLFKQTAAVCENVYISNTGGTPTMRSASHFAGLFQGYRYISLDASDDNESKVYQKQENQVLRQIVEKMLSAYDYEGIINLPVSENIKELCREALDLYNLKTNIVENQKNFGEKSTMAIVLLLNNLDVCFSQGRYADVLGRIFRIEEAVGQYLVYKLVKEKGLINTSDKVVRINSKGKRVADKTFETTLSNETSATSLYCDNFDTVFTFVEEDDKKGWYFSQFPTVPIKAGKSTFYYFFKSLCLYPSLYDFLFELNDGFDPQNNRLGKLRNRSYLGHGFQGVSKSDIEDITGPFETFFEKFRNLILVELEKNTPYDTIFKSVNKKIIDIY